MRADAVVGVADRDRNLNGRVEQLPSVRQPLMRVAPHVKFLRRAADEDRDRLERQLCLACRLGGVELRLQFLDFRSGLLLLVLGSCLGLVGLGGGEPPASIASEAYDPDCVKTPRGITAPGILGSMVMRRTKKRKNLSSARHHDQIRFRFHTTKTPSRRARSSFAISSKCVW